MCAQLLPWLALGPECLVVPGKRSQIQIKLNLWVGCSPGIFALLSSKFAVMVTNLAYDVALEGSRMALKTTTGSLWVWLVSASLKRLWGTGYVTPIADVNVSMCMAAKYVPGVLKNLSYADYQSLILPWLSWVA
eukprot:4233441-Karenia_brevis.AAC.1